MGGVLQASCVGTCPRQHSVTLLQLQDMHPVGRNPTSAAVAHRLCGAFGNQLHCFNFDFKETVGEVFFVRQLLRINVYKQSLLFITNAPWSYFSLVGQFCWNRMIISGHVNVPAWGLCGAFDRNCINAPSLLGAFDICVKCDPDVTLFGKSADGTLPWLICCVCLHRLCSREVMFTVWCFIS